MSQRPEIRIGDRIVKMGEAPFVIAEAGINHNGELEKAFEMIEVAASKNADAVKFQTFKAEEFVGDPNKTFTYRSQGKEVTESMLEMFKRYEFSKQEWQQIKKHCEKAGIAFLSTPQNVGDLELLLELGIDAIKIGSDDFTNIPLIKEYKKANKPMIMSCGMADLEEIKSSLEVIEASQVVLLLCTSQYPTPPQDVNLNKFLSLKREFPEFNLGFSDHTQGPLASSLAVAFGACVLEKHFTLNHELPGPDHWFSEDPKGLEEWVYSIRTAYQMMGSSQLEPTEEEKKMRELARRSITVIQPIKKGDVFSLLNLGLKRPGSGLPPKDLEAFLGKQAVRDLSVGELLAFEDSGES